jgi:hypothetical protein
MITTILRLQSGLIFESQTLQLFSSTLSAKSSGFSLLPTSIDAYELNLCAVAADVDVARRALDLPAHLRGLGLSGTLFFCFPSSLFLACHVMSCPREQRPAAGSHHSRSCWAFRFGQSPICARMIVGSDVFGEYSRANRATESQSLVTIVSLCLGHEFVNAIATLPAYRNPDRYNPLHG